MEPESIDIQKNDWINARELDISKSCQIKNCSEANGIKTLIDAEKERETKQGRTPHEYEKLGYHIMLINKILSRQLGAKPRLLLNETNRFKKGALDVSKIPKGLYVYEGLPLNFDANCSLLSKLFNILENGEENDKGIDEYDDRFPMRSRGNNNVLFDLNQGEDESKRFTFTQSMESIKLFDDELHDFILSHGRFCTKLMGIPNDQINKCQLHIVHYKSNGGISPHIDSVHTYGHTIGPIFTVNMDQGEKKFDLLPTLDPNGVPFRLFTQQGQITVMDGVSRVLWSHAIPEGVEMDRYTVAFKFPMIHDDNRVYNKFLGIEIPQSVPVPP